MRTTEFYFRWTHCPWLCSAFWIISLALHPQIVAKSDAFDERIDYTIISGVPFDIHLPIGLEINSALPRCTHIKRLQTGHDGRQLHWHLRGLCIAPDMSCSKVDKELGTLGKMTISNADSSKNQTVLIMLYMEYALFLPYPVTSYTSLALTTDDNSLGVRPPLSCAQRVPTVAIVQIHGDILQLTERDRCILWDWLAVMFLGNGTDSSKLNERKQKCTSKPYLNNGFRFISQPDLLLKNIHILATANVQTSTIARHDNRTKVFGFMYRIGCGSIASEALEILAFLEKQFVHSPVRLSELPVQPWKIKLSNYWITKWIVGDLINLQVNRVGRHLSRVSRSAKITTPDELTAQLSGLLDEGSGLLPTYRYPVPGSSSTFYPSLEKFAKSIPILQPIAPVKITVHQITNVQFPPKTFEKFDEVINTNFVVTLHRPDEGNLTESEIRSSDTPIERFGPPIARDTREWISFDAKSKIVRLRPLPQHVGNHQLILCAVAPNHPRACEPFYVTVRQPAPFRKNFILRIPPGIFWCYRVPIYWFEELKVTSFENLELSVNGDSPFTWDVQSAEICVVTMLRTEQIITLFFHASNARIAQSVEIEFRLSAKVPAVQRMISSSRLRLNLQWPKQAKSYQLHELNRINVSLAQALRVRVNPDVTEENLFIYDIINFFSVGNASSPARLEIEWVFLPQGLPADVDRDTVGDLEQLRQITRVGTLTGHQTSYLDRPNGLITLPELLKLCKSASLDGAGAALKATSDSFRPFVLDSVSLLELENSACHKAKQFTGRTASSTSLLSPWGVSDTVNLRLMPEVISNFTVTAGVSFKKTINPEKATPLKRIQFMELVDLRGTKLGDTAWLGLTSDNSRLFGLPLKHHIRSEPYVFSLQIYSVDQKTPISVGFTVEVQDWFGADMGVKMGDQGSNRFPNHRVRLRIMPTTTGTNWGVEPIYSLDYRWHLSTAIDKFLRPHCSPPCNPDVGIWELNKHADSNAIFVVWAQLSLLLENPKPDLQTQGTNRYLSETTPNTQFLCPWEKLNRLQNLLTFAPSVVSVEKNAGLVTGYTPNGQIFLAPWAAPSAPFRNHLATAGLGTVEAAVVDRMGACARGSIDQVEHQKEHGAENQSKGSYTEGFESVIQTFTIYTGEGFRHKISSAENLKRTVTQELDLYDLMGQKVGTSSWIGLEKDKLTVFGILMGNAVQPITYRFRIATSEKAPEGVTFAVHVAGSNPLLPAVFNHRVIMRFGAEFGHPLSGGHSLADRWRLVSALDAFLRPQCATDPSCKKNMDILLLTFNYQANGFTVIWSEKSLLIKSSNKAIASGTEERNAGNEQSGQWNERQHTGRNKKRAAPVIANQIMIGTQKRSPRSSSSVTSDKYDFGSCPERDVDYLERRLLGDTGFGLLPLPELAHHLKASGVGFLKEVQVERLGPCAKSLDNVPQYPPGSAIPVPFSHSVDSGGQPDTKRGTSVSSFGPTQGKDRQRLILLTTILPICVGVICILLVILGLVWYRKRGKQANLRAEVNSKLVTQGQDMTLTETQQMLPRDKQIDSTLPDYDRAGTLPSYHQTNGGGPRVKNYSDSLESSSIQPNKPLILANEQPPLKPPEYNLAYTESPATSPPQFHNGTPQMVPSPFPMMMTPSLAPGHSPRPFMPKTYYNTRPNPYRNLPPPIEHKPGMLSYTAQMTYAPYRRENTMQTHTSNTLPR